MECDVLDGSRLLLADSARRPRFLQVEAALNNPMMPRLGSKSEACAWSMAGAHGYAGCKGSPHSNATFGVRAVPKLYADRTLFLYQTDGLDHEGGAARKSGVQGARKPFWTGGPRMPTERAPGCTGPAVWTSMPVAKV